MSQSLIFRLVRSGSACVQMGAEPKKSAALLSYIMASLIFSPQSIAINHWNKPYKKWVGMSLASIWIFSVKKFSVKKSSVALVLSSIFLFTQFGMAEGGGSWNVKMSELSTALTDTIPDIFADPEKKEPIERLKAKTKKILSLTKDLDQGLAHSVRPDDPDPTIKFISMKFRQDIETAHENLQSGNTAYARHILRSSVSYCVACHTRNQSGPQFPLVSAFQKQLVSVPWIDRISFEAATRQFDTAFDDVLRTLNKKHNLGVKALDLEKGSRIALSMAVRVKESPDRVIQLAQTVLGSQIAGPSLKKDAEQWLKDARDWKAEKGAMPKTDAELLKAAKALVNKGEELTLGTWVPHAEVRYLRASNLMHNLMKTYPESPFMAEALYLIGISYDVLRDIGLWSLHEAFYEACVDRAPQSKTAMLCYQRFEDSVVGGFTGSSGTSVPSAIRDHLRRLKTKAELKSDSKK